MDLTNDGISFIVNDFQNYAFNVEPSGVGGIYTFLVSAKSLAANVQFKSLTLNRLSFIPKCWHSGCYYRVV